MANIWNIKSNEYLENVENDLINDNIISGVYGKIQANYGEPNIVSQNEAQFIYNRNQLVTLSSIPKDIEGYIPGYETMLQVNNDFKHTFTLDFSTPISNIVVNKAQVQTKTRKYPIGNNGSISNGNYFESIYRREEIGKIISEYTGIAQDNLDGNAWGEFKTTLFDPRPVPVQTYQQEQTYNNNYDCNYSVDIISSYKVEITVQFYLPSLIGYQHTSKDAFVNPDDERVPYTYWNIELPQKYILEFTHSQIKNSELDYKIGTSTNSLQYDSNTLITTKSIIRSENIQTHISNTIINSNKNGKALSKITYIGEQNIQAGDFVYLEDIYNNLNNIKFIVTKCKKKGILNPSQELNLREY